MGKVFCPSLKFEPFDALFWALGIALAIYWQKQLAQPDGLASLNIGTGTVLYGRGQLGSIWLKTRRLPAFSDLAILFIYGVEDAKLASNSSPLTVLYSAVQYS